MRRFFKKSKPDAVPIATDNSGVTVLIVDDSPTELHLIRNILVQGGYQVITAENGEAGVEEATRLQPDIILMDVVMPGLNGFQATRQLSRAPETSGIPIIMVTTKGQDTDRAWGLRQGAREYVVKPVAAKDLLGKISMVMSG